MAFFTSVNLHQTVCSDRGLLPFQELHFKFICPLDWIVSLKIKARKKRHTTIQHFFTFRFFFSRGKFQISAQILFQTRRIPPQPAVVFRDKLSTSSFCCFFFSSFSLPHCVFYMAAFSPISVPLSVCLSNGKRVESLQLNWLSRK